MGKGWFSMKTYNVKIIGVTALMHHKMSEEDILKLLGAKDKKKEVKQVFTPRELAAKHAYQYKDGKCYIPGGYLSGAFIQCSSDFKRTDNSKKSLKSIAAGAFRIMQEEILLKHPKNGKVLTDFEVDIRKGTNHQKGAVCVCRPRFDEWSAEFTVELDEQLISRETAQTILEESGRRVGIGSFRVSKQGQYGQFRIEHFKPIK